jgi:hypothetical protein
MEDNVQTAAGPVSDREYAIAFPAWFQVAIRFSYATL